MLNKILIKIFDLLGTLYLSLSLFSNKTSLNLKKLGILKVYVNE